MSGKIGAILLAAGLSRRMGSCKQLLPLGEETVMGRCIGTLALAGVDTTIVVVSPEGGRVAAEAERFPVLVVTNRETEGDMASSVRAGRDALSADVAGIVVALCDYPLVRPATVARLIRAHRAHPDRIVVPCHAGRRGHPLLFPRTVLHELQGGMILRDVVRRDSARILEVPVVDIGISLDMDTPADYMKICSLVAQNCCGDTSRLI